MAKLDAVALATLKQAEDADFMEPFLCVTEGFDDEGDTYLVNGVIKDPPRNSHLTFDAIIGDNKNNNVKFFLLFSFQVFAKQREAGVFCS